MIMTPKLYPSILLLCVLAASAVQTRAQGGHRASYYKDGEIHITVLGQPEGKAITTGHWDFKPSWSITGDHLVFFRRLKNDPVVSNWITQLCIINADGTGFHPLSLATFGFVLLAAYTLGQVASKWYRNNSTGP